jgi:hypothetical protein
MTDQALTEQERSVLSLRANLVSYRAIAKHLGISWRRARQVGECAEAKQAAMLADAGYTALWIAEDHRG